MVIQSCVHAVIQQINARDGRVRIQVMQGDREVPWHRKFIKSDHGGDDEVLGETVRFLGRLLGFLSL